MCSTSGYDAVMKFSSRYIFALSVGLLVGLFSLNLKTALFLEPLTHRFNFFIKMFINFLDRVDFKVSQRLGLWDFTALTHLCFSVALYMYILGHIALVFSFGF